MKIRALLIALAAALVLAGCGSDTSTSEPKEKTAKTAPKPDFDKKAYAAQIEKTFESGLMDRKIGDMCDPAYTHWACFYDGIEAKTEERIDIKLTTDGGWSKSDLKQMSLEARTHWFNAVGLDYPNLDTVVSFVNGLDTGTSYRRDNPMLAK